MGSKHGVYFLKNIEGEVKLTEHSPFLQSSRNVTLPFETFLSKWAVFKGEPPQKVDGKWFCPWDKSFGHVEAAKAKLVAAMRSHAIECNIVPDDVMLCLKPQGLRAGRDHAKGELEFVPYVGIHHVSHIARQGLIDSGFSQKIDGTSTTFWLARPSQPSKPKVEDWEEDDVVNPYFWIGSTTDSDEFNMVSKKVNVHGASFHVLVNKCAVKKGDLLRTYKEATIAEPLVGAKVAEKEDDAEPPAKKGRKAKTIR